MALPSSPPLLPEDYDLPSASSSYLQLPLASGSSAPIGPQTRKRQHSDYASLSSDPLFSDDTEEDSSQDAPGQPRRKRLVRGPWWHVGRRGSGQSLRRSMVRKDSFRNADSGVWMGSDASEESIDSVIESRQKMQGLAMEDLTEEDEPVPAPLDAEAYALRQIQFCLDTCKEAVDLSGLALNSLSDATLKPLHQLIKGSFREHTHPPSEDEFVPLTPSITLMLYTNQLTSLPNELFNLSNISVLSVRNNDLNHLPAAIARLTNLKELNIAGNNIRYLPCELLDIIHCHGKHRQITVRPNPLVDPTDMQGPSPLPKGNFTAVLSTEELSRFADTRETIDRMREKYAEQGIISMRAELELRLKLGRMLRIQYLQEASRAGRELKICREELIYLASSKVRYFGPDGLPARSTGRPSTAAGEDWSASLTPTTHAPEPSSTSTVPSLFELALRHLQRTHNLPEALPHLANSDLSPSIQSAVRLASTNSTGFGNEICSTCGKQFILARAEWMEYWFHGYPSQQELSAESVLPFLKRACSWGCARVTEVGEFRA